MQVEFLTQQNFHKTSPYNDIQKLRTQILKKKALAVFNNEKYFGIISVKDLAKNSCKLVIDCITEKQPVDCSCELNDVLDSMMSQDVDVLPVWKGNKLFGLVFKNDIVEYLKAYALELELKIAERTVQLENAMNKAKESEKLKSSFLANLSHEIRTPLNGILGFSDLLIEKEFSEASVKSYAQIINKSGKQLYSIINSVLLMSKLETGLLEFHNRETNLNALLQDIYDFFKLQTDKSDLELRLVKGLSDEKSNILVDEVRLRQIIDNLVNNAIKFTSNGYIEFGYSIMNNQINFFVKDSGIGISQEFHNKIFEPFQQVELNYLKNSQGVGLGLAISKGLVEMMGGKMNLQSKLNEGSEFNFALPYIQVSKPIIFLDNADLDNKSSGKIPAFSCLIVDDEPINITLLEELLTDSFIVEIFKAGSGQEAIDICIGKQSIDLVLMDLQMSVMDGLEATKRIKKINANIKIIAQSAYVSSHDIKSALSAGCDDFISKPIKQDELVKVIEKQIAR